MIRFSGVRHVAGAFRLEDISFSVPPATYAVLMGRTGSGKTTLLEILCGLRRADAGRIWIGERDVTDLQPGLRGIGYVPQDGALFPTMKVREQIGFALQIRHRSDEEIAERVRELSSQLGIDHLLERLPQNLSGGERQRVALARALAAKPKVLLFDEPLSALDEDTRDEIASVLKHTQRAHGVTALHITHSRREAAQLADMVFRLEDGAVRELSAQGE
jgi:ABC-type sugar transport system ATPase subunit